MTEHQTQRQSRRVVVISAGLSAPSSTRMLADKLGDAVARAVGDRESNVEVEHIELRPLAHLLADHLLTGFPTGELTTAQEDVRTADALIVVTPVFSASYSGLFKTFFDVLETGALDGMPVLLAATAGTARHSLVIDHAMRPLFAYLHATTVPTGVFAASEDFGSTADGSIEARVERAAAELAEILLGRPMVATPPRRGIADDFDQPTDFETLLREASGTSIR